MRLVIGPPTLQRLKKQTEAGDYKAESHERQPGSNPSEKGALCCKVITWAARLSV